MNKEILKIMVFGISLGTIIIYVATTLATVMAAAWIR